MPRKIEISYKTVIFTVGFLVLIWFVYFIRDIILKFFVALLIMAILSPLVRKMTQFKIPRILAILFVYSVLIGILILVISSIMPVLTEQTSKLSSDLPGYLVRSGIPTELSHELLKEATSLIGDWPSRILRVGVSLFSNIISTVTVFMFAFYLLTVREEIGEHLSSFVGDEKEKKIGKFIDKLEIRLGNWARGEIVLMFIVGFANYIGLIILGVPFALPLAFFAGILEAVPYIGPILSAIPSVIVGFGISPFTGVAVIALAFLVQQVENYLLVPKVMEKTVGVSPIIILLALAIGFRLAGVIGIIISIPVVITTQMLLEDFVYLK